MNYTQEQISMLKNIPISTYLHHLGIEPVREVGKQIVYFSPLASERTPSFYVHPIKNGFHCFSTGEKGDIIRLVCLLEKLAFKPALVRLESLNCQPKPIFSFSGQSLSTTRSQVQEPHVITLVSEHELANQTLIKYIVSRGIPIEIAKCYLREIIYENVGREYYGIGFKTDKGSYALRSKTFKGWLGASSIRTIFVAGSTSINLFEGFFDFLSVLTLNRVLQPDYTTIVLNSTTNINQALIALEGAKMVNCFFDNDNAGRAVLSKLRALQLPVNDCSGLYKNFNDFNDFLLAKTR